MVRKVPSQLWRSTPRSITVILSCTPCYHDFSWRQETTRYTPSFNPIQFFVYLSLSWGLRALFSPGCHVYRDTLFLFYIFPLFFPPSSPSSVQSLSFLSAPCWSNQASSLSTSTLPHRPSFLPKSMISDETLVFFSFFRWERGDGTFRSSRCIT